MDRVETESERLTADIALKDNTSTVTETQQRLLDFLRSVKLKYMKLGHGGYSWNSLASVIMFVLILPLSVATLVQLTGLRQNRIRSYSQVIMNILIHAALQLPISTTLCFLFWTKRSRPVYLVDFSCFKPGDDELKVSQDRVVTVAERLGFSDDAKRFMKLIISRACIGEESYLPRALLSVPPDRSFGAVFAEAEEAMFSSLDSLFGKTSLKHKYKDIGILIVNCSLIHPVPSLTSMIVNHYKLRTDIKTYNLGGMGCSAGLISIDLAKNLLEANPNSYAVVVSVEIIGGSWYGGNDKSKLIPNCLFRWGASAVLLSNLSSDRARSKYELAHSIRTHTGSIEEHFNCVRQAKDGDGIVGITLSKNLMSVAGDALKTNITTLAPLVLPWTEQLKFFLTLVRRKVFKASNVKAYVPDFKLAFKHFCIHPGGKAVMDAIEEKLALDKLDIEPSRMTLHRFGNTSSSSVWYVLAYVEAKGRVKRGDRVWQVALGSGYKCVSVVWKALEDIPADDLRGNAWIDSVHKYPVKLDVA